MRDLLRNALPFQVKPRARKLRTSCVQRCVKIGVPRAYRARGGSCTWREQHALKMRYDGATRCVPVACPETVRTLRLRPTDTGPVGCWTQYEVQGVRDVSAETANRWANRVR